MQLGNIGKLDVAGKQFFSLIAIKQSFYYSLLYYGGLAFLGYYSRGLGNTSP